MNLIQVFKLLADETRLRLLILLKDNELTVAELSQTLQLAQPRVSTHLAKLKESKFVLARKDGVSNYYRLHKIHLENNHSDIWKSLLKESENNSLIAEDLKRLNEVLSDRAKENNWVDSVAGDMERHYSPGRSWEATARALSYLLNLGDVLDIGCGDGVLAELLHKNAKSYTCVDSSQTAINAAKKRLQNSPNTRFEVSDMHQLDLGKRFDTVFLLHVLTYSKDATQAIAQAAKHLKPGGKLLISTLNQHSHTEIVQDFGHINNGFTLEQLKNMVKNNGFQQIKAKITSKEQRKPHFEVITLEAIKQP